MITCKSPKAVVVHAGARDSYQVAQALLDAGLLDLLVTNVYLPSWAKRHYLAEIPFQCVRMGCWGFAHYWLKKIKPYWKLERSSDHSLGRLARRLAHRSGSALVAYRYYASSAFRGGRRVVPKRI